MKNDAERALLPEGLHDELPPEAEHEAVVLDGLTRAFSAYGYERVKPPLVEFEESLLTGPGAGVSRHMFRLMDPISQRMMGVRSDMTTQVARIATTRLARAPRPLRLFYTGQVLRVRGSQLRPERQYTQAGAELIGADSAAGDAEIILLAVDALRAVGVSDLSVDLTLPSLTPAMCTAAGLSSEETSRICVALDQKDGAAIDAIADRSRADFHALMRAAGPVESAMAALEAINLPPAGVALRDKLSAVIAALREEDGELTLTVDPGENRGFAYQTGVSFTLFAKGVRGELGRGGRYDLDSGESAIGFTLYLDSLLRATPEPATPARVYLPHGTSPDIGNRLRADGWQTVRALNGKEPDLDVAAKASGCTHILTDGKPVVLD